jgi:hypothetical protein
MLRFPSERIVGSLEWLGSWDVTRGPVLATGDVVVPDDRPVSLSVQSVMSVERHGDSWQTIGGREPVHLGFIAELPGDAVDSLYLSRSLVPGSFGSVGHLAPGLRRLYLADTGLADTAVATIAELLRLVYLQSWGNHFTDAGVQPLGALAELEMLYLEEATLTVAAFDFAAGLPALQRLGLQDVTITPSELAELQSRLPGVRVGA